MEKIKINIYGASGHSKVVIDAIRSNNFEVGEIYDDNENINDILDKSVKHSFSDEFLNTGTLLAIGNNRIRKNVSLKYKGAINKSLSHTAACISSSVLVSEGTVIMANATINAGTTIGRHCIINTGAVVEHDCLLDDFVHISPNAALAGAVEVGEGTQIGIGAVVIQGIKIGKWVTVGAGAVIIKDVPDNVTIVGNPGKIIKVKD